MTQATPARRMTPARREALAASREATRASLRARLEAAIRQHTDAGDTDRAAWYQELLTAALPTA